MHCMACCGSRAPHLFRAVVFGPHLVMAAVHVGRQHLGGRGQARPSAAFSTWDSCIDNLDASAVGCAWRTTAPMRSCGRPDARAPSQLRRLPDWGLPPGAAAGAPPLPAPRPAPPRGGCSRWGWARPGWRPAARVGEQSTGRGSCCFGSPSLPLNACSCRQQAAQDTQARIDAGFPNHNEPNPVATWRSRRIIGRLPVCAAVSMGRSRCSSSSCTVPAWSTAAPRCTEEQSINQSGGRCGVGGGEVRVGGREALACLPVHCPGVWFTTAQAQREADDGQDAGEVQMRRQGWRPRGARQATHTTTAPPSLPVPAARHAPRSRPAPCPMHATPPPTGQDPSPCLCQQHHGLLAAAHHRPMQRRGSQLVCQVHSGTCCVWWID